MKIVLFYRGYLAKIKLSGMERATVIAQLEVVYTYTELKQRTIYTFKNSFNQIGVNMKKVLSDYLLASPYSWRTNLNRKLTEEEFENQYIVVQRAYKKMESSFNNKFANLGTKWGSFFLHGYAGMGKTTFLYWYLKKNQLEYNKIIFNLIDEDTDHQGNLKIFDMYFHNLITELYEEFKNDFDKLLRKIKSKIVYYGAFSLTFKNHILKSNDNFNIHDFVSFVEYQDGLLFFLLFYSNFSQSDFSKIKSLRFIPRNYSDRDSIAIPLILAFDNIDHIEIEGHNCLFPINIKRAINSCGYILNTIGENGVQIHSVYCLRDANFSLVNRGLEEIDNVKKIGFLPIKYENVINKRLLIAKNDNVIIDQKHIQFFKSMFFKKKSKRTQLGSYARSRFMPLFNLNYRKLVEFITDDSVFDLHDNSILDSVINLSKDDNSVHGARGIIYYYLIKYLNNKDYLKETLLIDDSDIKFEGTPPKGKINPARMILTIIHNMNGFYLNNDTQPIY